MNRREVRLFSFVALICFAVVSVACNPVSALLGPSADEKAMVSKVEVTTLGGQSPRYAAQVTGDLPDSCTQIGRTRQEVVRMTIRVSMYTRKTDGTGCLPQSVPFKERVVLDVSGLKAGSYAVDVNGAVASFTLTEDH